MEGKELGAQSQDAKRWSKALAAVAGLPGGRSGLGRVIPVNLLASEEKQQAHELLGDKEK